MSEEGKPIIKLVSSQEDKTNKMFLVTVKTTYDVKDGKIVSNKIDLHEKEILQVEEREVLTSELEHLGTEASKYNQRQEFYAIESNKMNGDINFMYLASKDPRKSEETPTED